MSVSLLVNVFSCTSISCYSSVPPQPLASFGGTDGQYHYNDTWSFDIQTRQWSELQCIGYIPQPREGHAAAVIDDVMYVFGGRGVDGKDLNDLAAFKISSMLPPRPVTLASPHIRQINGGTCSRTWVQPRLAAQAMPWPLSAPRSTSSVASLQYL